MKKDTYFQFFIFFLLPPVILVLGFFGNITGVIVMRSKRLVPMATRRMYSYLFFFDSIYLIHLVINYLELSYGIDITFKSSEACKAHIYLNYSLATISPMILVYISIERYVEIKYPAKRFVMRKNKLQIIYLTVVAGVNLLFYLPFPILIDQNIMIDDENHFIMCSFKDATIDIILSYMDLVNRVILPFVLMIICSCLLTYSIFKSRQKVIVNYASNDNHTFKKDLKLSVTSVLLNLIYVLFCLPISINDFANFSEFNFTLTLYIFYMTYAVNFYIVLMFNSLVRREFLILFRLRSAHEQTYVVRYIQIDSSRQSNQLTEINLKNDKDLIDDAINDNYSEEDHEINNLISSTGQK